MPIPISLLIIKKVAWIFCNWFISSFIAFKEFSTSYLCKEKKLVSQSVMQSMTTVLSLIESLLTYNCSSNKVHLSSRSNLCRCILCLNSLSFAYIFAVATYKGADDNANACSWAYLLLPLLAPPVINVMCALSSSDPKLFFECDIPVLHFEKAINTKTVRISVFN